jgi:hypothetical protein
MMNTSIDLVLLILLLAVNLIIVVQTRLANERLRWEFDRSVDALRTVYRAIDRDWRNWQNWMTGVADQTRMRSRMAEKFSERAFSLASSANLACMAIQRTLQVRPQYVVKNQQIANEVAQKTVMEKVGGSKDYSGFDWIYPILSDEDRDLLDKALQGSQK